MVRQAAKRQDAEAAGPWRAGESRSAEDASLPSVSHRQAIVGLLAMAISTSAWEKAREPKPCAVLPRPPEGGALRGSAPVACYAVWKTAISAAADLRVTLTAAGVLVS